MPVELKKELWECPGEAHHKDMCFNPNSQGPYGDGYHECDVCDGEYYISYRDYKAEIEFQQRCKEFREQAKLINKISTLPQVNVPQSS